MGHCSHEFPIVEIPPLDEGGTEPVLERLHSHEDQLARLFNIFALEVAI
jgi:hypothetical protein